MCFINRWKGARWKITGQIGDLAYDQSAANVLFAESLPALNLWV